MIFEIPRWFLAKLSPFTLFKHEACLVDVIYGFSSREIAEQFKAKTGGFNAQYIG